MPKDDKRRESLRGVCGPALRVPTRLAVGFGLEALEALASFTPDGGKPSLIRFPRSSAPRIRLASRHLRRRTECSATGVRVKRPDALYLMMRRRRWLATKERLLCPWCRVVVAPLAQPLENR